MLTIVPSPIIKTSELDIQQEQRQDDEKHCEPLAFFQPLLKEEYACKGGHQHSCNAEAGEYHHCRQILQRKKEKFCGEEIGNTDGSAKEKFPDARVIRMDADTTEGRTSHEKLLEQFGKGEADILVGTQMVAKGLDFENVTLVGVADADLSLFSGDTYAAERVFSLLTQVVGRSGRRGKAGRAVIQTMVPENPVIRAAAQQDYLAFYSSEIENRRLMEQPPFADTFVFMVTGQTEHEVNKAALRLSATLQQAFDREFRDIAAPVLGPVPAVLARINKRYRYQVSFRGRDDKRTRELVMAVLTAFQQAPESRTVTVTADKNPYTI